MYIHTYINSYKEAESPVIKCDYFGDYFGERREKGGRRLPA